MPECVVPRNEGVINLTVQVHQKLLMAYFNTGEAVDHSIMGPQYSWCSHKRMKLQGHRSTAKGKYIILCEFYYSAMQQISDKCDAPPCQHLTDFTCNQCDQYSYKMFMYIPLSLTLPWSEKLRWDWFRCYTISPSEIRNLYQKQYKVDLQHLQMEWSDWCYWDVSVVTPLLQFVLHELHPDDIVFKVIHGEYTHH